MSAILNKLNAVQAKRAPVCRCENCDWTGSGDDLGKTLCEIHHLWERLDVGGVVPAGECPECLAFAYLEEEEQPQPKLPAVQTLLRDPSASFWFKDSLASAMQRDPCDALNDAQTLVAVLQRRIADRTRRTSR